MIIYSNVSQEKERGAEGNDIWKGRKKDLCSLLKHLSCCCCKPHQEWPSLSPSTIKEGLEWNCATKVSPLVYLLIQRSNKYHSSTAITSHWAQIKCIIHWYTKIGWLHQYQRATLAHCQDPRHLHHLQQHGASHWPDQSTGTGPDQDLQVVPNCPWSSVQISTSILKECASTTVVVILPVLRPVEPRHQCREESRRSSSSPDSLELRFPCLMLWLELEELKFWETQLHCHVLPSSQDLELEPDLLRLLGNSVYQVHQIFPGFMFKTLIQSLK